MSTPLNSRIFFTRNLLKWHFEENDRQLPWKNEKDPYKIWLSEIILQQTRAEQGLPYYQRFIEQYPDVHLLAGAPEAEVFRLWQGLGYYNRCRNLIAAAQTLSRDYKGKFPHHYEAILALKGVGNYTAAAIASFAFGLPYAVLDGNVYRVLARYFGIDTETDSTAGKKEFQELAQELLDQQQPAAFNQAIMDFGASVCKPKAPECNTCILAPECVAYKRDMVQLLPVKGKKIKVTERYFHYFVLQVGDEVYIRERTAKDIWQNLFEFYLVETGQATLQPEDLPVADTEQVSLPSPVFSNRQRLTHQLIISDFYLFTLKEKPGNLKKGLWIKSSLLKNYAFPKTILSFFNRKNYF
jgi:A/G-specific adenine glycosylase